MHSTYMPKWPVVKDKHIKRMPRVYVAYYLYFNWTINEKLLQQNISD